MSAGGLEARFVADVLRNARVRAVLERWSDFALPDGWLVAGCLFQTVWNLHSGNAPDHGIADYDVFYFDAADLGAEAEALTQARVQQALAREDIAIEVKNQARVHTWYETYFGVPCPALASACEGIDRFLVASTSVGLRPRGDGYEVYAPHGLEDLYAGRLTFNPLTPHAALFREKAASYQRRWPWLQVVDLPPDQPGSGSAVL